MSEQILLLPYFYKGVIYLIENIQNHKKYVGKTGDENPENYIEDHFRNAVLKYDKLYSKFKRGKYLYNAIRKYGIQNFKWRILGEVYATSIKELNDNLNEAEIETIYFYRSYGTDGEHFDDIYGYNMTKGGEGTKGRIPTQEEIKKNHTSEINEKRSKKLKGRKFTEEHRRKKSLAQTGEKNHRFGKHQTIEQNKKQSEIMSGENNSFYGKHHTEETLEKLRKPKTEEHKRKISESLKGKQTGSNSPRALKLKITSPFGQEFFIHGELYKFCKEHNLKCPNELSKVAYNKRNNYLGWKAEFYE
jgi:hypothetical protein